jgi:TolB-like protein
MASCAIVIIVVVGFPFLSNASGMSRVEKKRIAILEFSANNVPPSYANIVRNTFEIFLFNEDRFQLIDREQLQAIARKMNLNINSDNSPADMVRLGQRLSTDFLMTGSLDKLDKYRLSVRIISVDRGEILTTYYKVFKSADDINDAADKLAESSSNDMQRFLITGKVRQPFFVSHRVILGIRANYISPVNSLNYVLNPGFGGGFFSEFDNLLFEDGYLGLQFNYNRFRGSDNVGDEANIVPFMISAGYRHYFSRKMYLKTEAAGGAAMISLIHRGEKGFNQEDNTEKHGVSPVLQVFGGIGVAPAFDIYVEMGAYYGWIFEKSGSLSYFGTSLSVMRAF